MTGTEKQVAWAQDIERKTLTYIDASISLCEERAKKYEAADESERAEMYRIFRQAITNLFASEKMQSAAYVISKRGDIPDASTVIDQATIMAGRTGEEKIDVLRKMLRAFL